MTSAAVFVITAFLMWLSALSLQDYFLTKRALYDLSLTDNGGTPFVWSMDDERDITRDNRNGIEQIVFADGVARFVTGEDDTYFSLNPRGRLIDASAYTKLSMRIFSSDNAELQVVHRYLNGGLNAHGTKNLFQLSPGWQIVQIDMAAEPHLLSRDRNNPPDALHTIRWGGTRQIVTGLRVDPTQQSGVSLGIDWIKLERHSTSPQPPKIVADQDFWRWPQSVAARRQQLLEENPQTVFLPYLMEPPTAAQLQSAEEVGNPLAAYEAGLSAAALLLTFLVIAVTYRKGRPNSGKEARALLVVMAVLSLFLWLTADDVPSISFSVPAAVLLLVGGYAITLNDGPGLSKAGIQLGSKAAWLDTLYCTLPVLFAVLLLRWIFGEATFSWSLLGRTLMAYIAWGAVQQFILCSILTGLILMALGENNSAPGAGKRWLAAWAAGIYFALMHTPNLTLMLITLGLGPLWANIYIKHRTILPLALAHGVLGALFQLLAPSAVRINGSVGLAHFNWLW